MRDYRLERAVGGYERPAQWESDDDVEILRSLAGSAGRALLDDEPSEREEQ